MKTFFKVIGIIVVMVMIYKGVQMLLWIPADPLLPPPSLESWDATERYEAAARAGKKFGVKP